MVRRFGMAAMAGCALLCGCATAADYGFPGNSTDDLQEGDGDGGAGGFGGAPGVINVSSATTTQATSVTSTSVTSTSVTTSGGGECDLGSCESCQQCAMNGVCSGSVDACLANTECGALWECLSGCADDICANDCANAHAGGMDQFNAVGECVFCTACPITCGC
jgi:hypothetical protein